MNFKPFVENLAVQVREKRGDKIRDKIRGRQSGVGDLWRVENKRRLEELGTSKRLVRVISVGRHKRKWIYF